MIKKYSIALALNFLLFSSFFCFANEPLWTNKERAEKRDAVVKVKVKEVKPFTKFGDSEQLMLATVEVRDVVKSNNLVKGKSLKVYYLVGLEGNIRHPSYPELSKNDVVDLYMTTRPLFKDGLVLFVELGSDVRDPLECTGSKAKKNLFCH